MGHSHSVDDAMLARIVLLIPDLSRIGGIPSRTRKVLRNAIGRRVEYVALSLTNHFGLRHEQNTVLAEDPEKFVRLLEQWNPKNTVIMFPNNTLKALSPNLRTLVERFPLIFNGSGQLSYLIQDSPIIADLEYISGLRVSKIVLFSELDRMTYSQFGIYEHELLFHPTDIQKVNTFSANRNTSIGYVGRIDFFAKGADRLIVAAKVLNELQLGPLLIFTVEDKRNSPQLEALKNLFAAANLLDSVQFIMGEEDKDKIFGRLKVLLLPSRKDAFPNVVLEANGRGVPVLSMSHAPGPAELIKHGKTGWLVDKFDEVTLRSILHSLNENTLNQLSKNAFAHHKSFGFDRYFGEIERIANDAVLRFEGQNNLQVLPELSAFRGLRKKNSKKPSPYNYISKLVASLWKN